MKRRHMIRNKDRIAKSNVHFFKQKCLHFYNNRGNANYTTPKPKLKLPLFMRYHDLVKLCFYPIRRISELPNVLSILCQSVMKWPEFSWNDWYHQKTTTYKVFLDRCQYRLYHKGTQVKCPRLPSTSIFLTVRLKIFFGPVTLVSQKK